MFYQKHVLLWNEAIFNWLIEKVDIQRASKVRSTKGLLVHAFGRLAIAFINLKFNYLFILEINKPVLKKNILLSIVLISTLSITAQVKVDYQFGGSNFIGYSLNTEFDIPIIKDKGYYIMPRFGVGMVVPGITDSTILIHFGLHYRIRKIGIGCEVSGYSPNPFSLKENEYDDNYYVDIMA